MKHLPSMYKLNKWPTITFKKIRISINRRKQKHSSTVQSWNAETHLSGKGIKQKRR